MRLLETPFASRITSRLKSRMISRFKSRRRTRIPSPVNARVASRALVCATAACAILAFIAPASARHSDASTLPHDPPETAVTPERLREAVERAVPLMQNSADTWFEKRSCSSCHHQGLGTVAMSVISEHGFVIDTARMHAQAVRTMRQNANWAERFVVQDVSINQSIGQTYRAIGVAAAGHPGNAVLRAIAHLTAGQQHVSGRWLSNSRRPPLEDSEVTATALSIRTLSLYPIAGREGEFAQRIDRAREWLLNMTPESNEERVMQLFGAAWGGADSATLDPHATALLSEQREDGGWAQVATRASDAYATGQALVALNQSAGISMRDARMQRAQKFLLAAQKDDGSWHVPTTRTREPGLPYFESGFPHGKDQFISYAGTAWATMAIAMATRDAPSNVFVGHVDAAIELPPDTVSHGLTPLQHAALFGTREEMQRLIDAGANVNDTSASRATALMAAVHDEAKVRLLLDAGADPSVENRAGHTALQLAASYSGASASARLLIERGAKQDHPIRSLSGARVAAFAFAVVRGDTLLAQFMLDRGADVNGPTNAGHSPLMAATYHADGDAARWLLRRGAMVDDRARPPERLAMTPLMIAAVDGCTDVVRALIDAGADVNKRDHNGLTALHHAAGAPDRGHMLIVDALLAAGAERAPLSPKGETPAAFARQYGKPWVAARIEQQ